jgi:hypothetical protein
MKFRLDSLSAMLILILFGCQTMFANPPEYIQRQESYTQTALNNFRRDDVTLQAYKGLPVDRAALNNLLDEAQTSKEADFRIIRLVRVLCLSDGEYDAQIIPVLQGIKFWLHPEGDKSYISENHIIMWGSSNWLLYEKYNFPIDSTLRKRIVHFLQLKIQYGFYEFFSTVYTPYTLAGILNLADFAEDPEIKNLAIQAGQRLLKDFLLVANDKGVMFPAAGRNYNEYYLNNYGSESNKIIWLLTGFGDPPTGGGHNSNFLATSSIPVTEVIQSWSPELNITYKIGHSLQDGIQNINNGLNRFDRTVFQWISGAYFHPDVAEDSYWLIDSLRLYNAIEQFSMLAPLFEYIDLSNLAEPLATLLGSASRSSVISGQTVDIFRNRSVVMSSVQDYWKGRLGWQQFPWAINTGTASVYTQSGIVKDFSLRKEPNNNSHLPYIDQKDNVALIMYRPNRDLALMLPFLGANTFDVSLKWPVEKFDEQREHGNWIIGREKDGYVAIRRHCNDQINGIPACNNPDGQTWVAIVGNANMYGSFDNFEDVIKKSTFESRWHLQLQGLQWVYYSKVVIDGKTIEYAWNGNIFSGPTSPTGVFDNTKATLSLSVFPNPANRELNVDISAFNGREVTLRIFNISGQEIFKEVTTSMHGPLARINTESWNNGLYIVSVDSENYTGIGQFVVQH